MKKKQKLKFIPVVVQLYPQQVHEADLMRELKIDSHRLDRELMRQPARYAFWASLYSTVAAKVEQLKEELDNLEAKLSIRYSSNGGAKRKYELKYHVVRNKEFQHLRSRLRRWMDSERTLKYGAMRGFEHRLSCIMALNANRRADKKSESFKEEEE
jgi:hypothetical protein